MTLHCALWCILQVLMAACLISYLPVTAYTYYNCSGCQSFPSQNLDISDVKQILIDDRNDKIIVGARNCLLRLEPSLSSDPSNYDYAKLSPTDDVVQQCLSSGKPKKVCYYNYIRLLLFDNSKNIFACGTYAARPKCWRFEKTGAFSPISRNGIDGYTQSPSYPDQNVTGVVSEQPANKDYLFTGINLGSGTSSSTIYRKSISGSGYSNFLRTEDSELFLKDANFVSSYTATDNFIYFFWREKAMEDQNQNIYSRVGRVCTYDAGGAFILNKRFTSFTKARLSCTVSGSVDFSYDHLQSTFKFINSESDAYIYGIFTTPETGLLGSAVCVYSLKSIQSLFSNSKYLEEVQLPHSEGVISKAWKSVMPLPNVQDAGKPNCTASLDTKNYAADTTKFAKSHPLLTDVMQPNERKPLFIMPNLRFTQIVVDDVKVGSVNQSIQVLFLATDNGTVYKLAQISPGKTATIVEQINVFQTAKPILTMKLFKKSLYIGSNSGVVRVSTNRCGDFKTCCSCIEQKDPYCGWSNKRCISKDDAGQSRWVQDLFYGRYVSVCPDEPPFCTIKVLSNSSRGDISLECSGSGIPMPLVTEWQKDSKKVSKQDGYKFQNTQSQHSQQLLISKFGLEHLGKYQCTVQNNKGSKYTCTLPIQGTLPVIFSGFSKSQGQTYFWCKATGIPKPTISIHRVIEGIHKVIQSDTLSVNQDYGNRMYLCVAQNTFGPSKSRNYTINERIINVEIKIKEENWTDSLKDPKSHEYEIMSERLKKAVQSVYSHDTAFLDITNITFSKGSVVADVSLRFGASPSDKDTDLLVDLQEAIQSGKIGSLKVQKTNVMSKYTKGPTVGYRDADTGIDKGLFVVAILIAIVLSILVGFLMGIKFHRQAINSCTSNHDTSIHEDKDIQKLKYMKSPTMTEETRKYPNKNHSDRKSLHRDGDGKEVSDSGDLDDGDHVSTGSSGGRIVYIHKPDPSTTPERKILLNGKIQQTL